MYRQKNKIAAILAVSLLVSACGKKSEQTMESSGEGTIRDVYNESESVTDNLGQPQKAVRNIREKYPDLSDYTGIDSYTGIYVPALQRDFSKADWHVIERNASYTILQNREEPTASYTFGHISDINPVDNSDYSVFSTIYPLVEICYMKDGEPELMNNYYTEVLSVQQDQINGIVAQGFRFETVSKYDYIPAYSYMVFSHVGDDVNYEMMVTDNVYQADGNRKKGEPKESYVLDTRTNVDGKRLIDATTEAPEVEYKIYNGDVTMAVPSFMDVMDIGGVMRVKERNGEYTPFNHAGASVYYLSDELNTKSQVDVLINELNILADNNEVLKCGELNYEDNIIFMGVDDATHLYGSLFLKDGGIDARKAFCGTGKIRFDIFCLQRNEKKLLVMFYYGEDQAEEFWDFIMYNCY